LVESIDDSYFYSNYSSWRFWGALRKLTQLAALAIALVSFIVGMILNATLGAKILGFGFAALLGIMVITTVGILIYEVVQSALWSL
jgi:hypothetical protein